MSISGNRETGGRPLSTADLAAAARQPDSGVDANEEPVLNEERSPATDRDEQRMRQSAAGTEAQQRTEAQEGQQRPMRRNVEGKMADGSRSAKRELADTARTADVGGSDRPPETRAADEADARPGGRWFSERDASSADADRPQTDTAARSGEALEPLFTPELAETYRVQWTSIQSGFVDDPRRAVRSGDELVAQIMTNLANTFAEERHRVEAQLDSTGEGSTEELRVTLRRYRSFFERLLSL
jgi:hypothetical protein